MDDEQASLVMPPPLPLFFRRRRLRSACGDARSLREWEVLREAFVTQSPRNPA